MTRIKPKRLLPNDTGNIQLMPPVRLYRCAMAALLLLTVIGALPPKTQAQSGANISEWSTYGADLANTRYKPFDQINAVQLQQTGSRLDIQNR